MARLDLEAASYNDASELTSQTYPAGDTLTSNYDPSSGWATGASVQLSGAQSATPLLSGESYSGTAGAMGLLTGATLGAFTGGSGAYAASYDRLGRVTSSATTYTPSGGSATTLYQTQPTYDALGNVIATTTTLPTGIDTQVFCYDDLARLTWAGSSGTPACSGAPTPSDTGSLSGTSAQYSASYSYDAMNRLTSAPLGAYTYGDSAHVDAATAIGSSWTASYDAAGNMTCRAATSATTCAGSSPTGAALSYDNEGRLASWQNTPGSSPTQSAAYLYDGAGQRVQQVATASGGVTTTSYIGNLEEVTSSGGATTTTTAYYGGLAESVNGALSYLLSDGLGSATASVSAASGSVTATQLYGPYGVVRYQSGTLPTDHGYTGQVSDATTSGLDYYGARYYDAVAGQFTSADTTLAGGLNEYAYVGGNPESRTDPSGHHYACPTSGCSVSDQPPSSPPPSSPPPSSPPPSSPPPSPVHQTVQQAPNQWTQVLVSALEASGVGLTTASLAQLLLKYQQTKLMAALQSVLETLLEHNHWAKNLGRFFRRMSDAAGLKLNGDFIDLFGKALLVAGFMVDFVTTMIQFYNSSARPDYQGPARAAVAVWDGLVHATLDVAIVEGASWGAAAGVTFFTEGIGAAGMMLVKSSVGFVAGAFAPTVSNPLTAAIIDNWLYPTAPATQP